MRKGITFLEAIDLYRNMKMKNPLLKIVGKDAR